MRKVTGALLALMLLVPLGAQPAFAQRHDQFYNGVRDGGRGAITTTTAIGSGTVIVAGATRAELAQGPALLLAAQAGQR